MPMFDSITLVCLSIVDTSRDAVVLTMWREEGPSFMQYLGTCKVGLDPKIQAEDTHAKRAMSLISIS